MVLPLNSPDSKALSLKLRIASSPFQAICDSLLNLASTICETRFALISLKDIHAHIFITAIGIEGVDEIAVEHSFCRYATANTLIEIEDATVDERFRDNPYVTDDPRIRFYAGVPIALPTGEDIGTICVFDQTPKRLNEQQKQALTDIAKTFLNTMVAQDFVFKKIASSDSAA